MKFGMKYKQGEIAIVPFPFSDLSSIKQRPVLILSKSKYNRSSGDLVTCGITSNLKNSEYSVLINNFNLNFGSIPIKSRIKVDKIFTIDKKIIKKKIGFLNEETLDKVKEEFFKIIK